MANSIETMTALETEQLQRQLLHAQKLSSVGVLASSLAHEFNNILTSIINYAKLGLEASDDENRAKSLEKIMKAGQRAAALTTSMLGFTRKNSTRREPCNIVRLVEDVLLLTEKDLRRHQIQVDTRFEGQLQAPVVAGQIEQILLNLIINARQAMPDGGKLRIEVRENLNTHMVEIRIADTGCGIPADKLRLIFEPFYTTKDPDNDGQGGTGLGLSVCRQIIEHHQGRIRVESLAGKGSTFTVKLPMVAAACTSA